MAFPREPDWQKLQREKYQETIKENLEKAVKKQQEAPDAYLIGGLVGKHKELYMNNANFHGAIKLLAKWLPPFIDVIAQQAEENQRLINKRIQELERGQIEKEVLGNLKAFSDPEWNKDEPYRPGL